MANYGSTTVKCKNPEVLKTVIRFEEKHWQKSPGEFDFTKIPIGEKVWHELNFVSDDFTEAVIRTRGSVFEGVVIELSKMFKKDEITCIYSYEDDWYFNQYYVRYKAGKGKQIDIKYNPGCITDPGIASIIGEKESEAVHERVHEFIDLVYKHKILREDETINFEFMQGQYKVVTEIPFGPYYETKVYKKVERKKTFSPTIYDDWEQIKLRPELVEVDDELPF